MTWIFLAYLLGLLFLATRLTDREKLSAFRKAWITFALIPVTQFIMHLFRVGNLRDVRDLQVIELWNQAVPTLLFGISLLFLVGALAPNRTEF